MLISGKKYRPLYRRPYAAHGCISYDWIFCIHVSMHNYFRVSYSLQLPMFQ